MIKKYQTKSVLVIGLGRFGRHLALKIQELGNSVMIVDMKEPPDRDFSANFEDILIGDCTNETVLKSIGVANFDICFVTIGTNFEASIVITSLLKNLGAKHIVTKASRHIQADVLRKVGADEIVDPEREMAEKLAVRYNMRNVFDYIELSDGYSIFEIAVPANWFGKSIGILNVRRKHKINILAVKRSNTLHPLPGADFEFHEEDVIITLGREMDIMYLNNQ